MITLKFVLIAIAAVAIAALSRRLFNGTEMEGFLLTVLLAKFIHDETKRTK